MYASIMCAPGEIEREQGEQDIGPTPVLKSGKYAEFVFCVMSFFNFPAVFVSLSWGLADRRNNDSLEQRWLPK